MPNWLGWSILIFFVLFTGPIGAIIAGLVLGLLGFDAFAIFKRKK